MTSWIRCSADPDGLAGVDDLLASPMITTQRVRHKLGVSSTGATNMLRQLENVGILRQMAGVPGRSNRWIAPEAMAAVRDETPTT